MARMVSLIFQSIFGCVHAWNTVDRQVVATWQKGQREYYSAFGDYEECKECPAGRFVPYKGDLSIVPCKKEIKNARLSTSLTS